MLQTTYLASVESLPWSLLNSIKVTQLFSLNKRADDGRYALILCFTFGEGVECIDISEQ